MALVVSTTAVPGPASGATPSVAVERGLVGGILDPLTTVLPVPAINGLGGIVQQGGTYECVNSFDALGLVTCAAIPLTSLGATETVLRAVPADGYTFGGWAGCPTPAGDLCTIGSGLLGSLVAPVATFLPVPGLPGTDTEPPTVTITASPDATTTETDASFTFTADEAGTTFECQLTGGSGQQAGFTACSSPRTYTGLVPSETPYTFEVRGTDPSGNQSSPSTRVWMIEAETAPAPPETFLTDAPRNNSWLLRDFVSFDFTSNEGDAGFRCGLDGRVARCDSGQKIYTSLSSRTHTFRVAAVNGTEVDQTPARRTFTVPRNNNTLRHSAGWKKRTGSGYFLRTYSETHRQGAWVKKRAGHIKRVALVASKGRGYGTVEVYLGRTLLRKVSLSANRFRKHRLVPIKTFKHKKRGTIRVVVVSTNRTVRIEGLGIATR